MTISENEWCLYVLQCADGTLYTGITNNLDRRLKAHNSGRGAKYTRSRSPCEVLRHILVGSKSCAAKSESRFKKLSRQQKIDYVLRGLEKFLEDRCSDLFPKNLNTNYDYRQTD